MDFGALPPEINSARMYSGPGSAPMRTASAAWNLLAAELESAAIQYQSTIDVLDDEWLGPTSATMAAAVDPYITWMSTTSAQAEQTAAQASAAASAYEAAYAMTVPPLEVAANRMQLAMLVATNVIGQNTAAIAANEAMYGEMWAQDAAAMYGYAGSSAAASSVKAFTAAAGDVESSGPGHAGLGGHAGKRRQHRGRCAVAAAAADVNDPVVVEATHLAGVRGDECGREPSGLARQLPRLFGRRGRELDRNLPELILGERFRVGPIRQPRDRHARDHQRYGRHQLVATKRRVGARGRRRYRA